jgi:hypothetical protein
MAGYVTEESYGREGTVETDERLGELVEHSEKIDQLAAALAKAEGEMHAVATDSLNTFYKRDGKPSPYASLAAVRAATIPDLSKYDLALTQYQKPRPFLEFEHTELKKQPSGEWRSFTYKVQCMAYLVTTVMHSSGQWIKSYLPIVCMWGDVQRVKGTITYLRRTAWESIVAIAQQEEDDDGNTATGRRVEDEDRRVHTRQGNGQRQEPQPQSQPQPQPQRSELTWGQRLQKWIDDEQKKDRASDFKAMALDIMKAQGYGENIAVMNKEQADVVYRHIMNYINASRAQSQAQS